MGATLFGATSAQPPQASSRRRNENLAFIFQEILTNVSRHAQATQVRVTLQETGEHLILQVHDNGRGISQEEIDSPKSIGLLGTRERALLRGGDVDVEGTAGQGTTVTVRLPVEPTRTTPE